MRVGQAKDAARRWVYARCQDARANILRHLESLHESAPLHDRVTAWLFAAGVTTHVLLVAGLQRRGAQVRAFLPRLWAVAEDILAANPGIEDALAWTTLPVWRSIAKPGPLDQR